MKQVITMVLIFICCIISACSSFLEDWGLNESSGTPLTVNVQTFPLTKSLISDSYLPDKSKIGVTLLRTDGTPYLNTGDYTNVFYEANGTTDQVWVVDPTKNIYLTDTQGIAYAYYPYDESVDNIEMIDVDASKGIDYMYSEPTGTLVNSSANASFLMKHALSIVRCSIVRGTYNGVGNVTSVEIEGSTLAKYGKMNAKTGGMVADAAPVSYVDALSIGQMVELLVVPTGVSSTIKFTLEIDGKKYSVTSSNPVTLASGQIYKYILNINSGALETKTVGVDSWGQENLMEDLGTYEQRTIYTGTVSMGISGYRYEILVNDIPVLQSISNGTFSYAEGDKVSVVAESFYRGIKLDGVTQSLTSYSDSYISSGKIVTFTASSNHEIFLVLPDTPDLP